MNMNKAVGLGVALVSDMLPLINAPGGSTFAYFATSFMEKRNQKARDILISKIASGEIVYTEDEIDPLISILLRFSKAVEDGAAIQNLELLAQVIAGLKKNKTLSADKFNRWAAILAHLTRDEILAIGKAYQVDCISDIDNRKNAEFWEHFSKSMKKSGYTDDQIASICVSVSRYGLFIPMAAWEKMHYYPSEWLRELGQLATLSDLSV